MNAELPKSVLGSKGLFKDGAAIKVLFIIVPSTMAHDLEISSWMRMSNDPQTVDFRIGMTRSMFMRLAILDFFAQLRKIQS